MAKRQRRITDFVVRNSKAKTLPEVAESVAVLYLVIKNEDSCITLSGQKRLLVIGKTWKINIPKS